MSLIKIGINHIIAENAIAVLFNALNNNLLRPDPRFNVGDEYYYISRLYTAEEYGNETGIYYGDEVAYITVIYVAVVIKKITINVIGVECEVVHINTHTNDMHDIEYVRYTVYESTGMIPMARHELETMWELAPK